MLNLDDLLSGVGPSTPPAQAAPPPPPRLELRQNPQLTPQVELELACWQCRAGLHLEWAHPQDKFKHSSTCS